MSIGKPGPAKVPGLVLDTNVVLDWLVFGDPSSAPIAAWLQGGRARWLICAAVEREVRHQLAKGRIGGFDTQKERALTLMQNLSCMCADPPASPMTVPRCRDADDQVFIDLALAEGAHWLVTRDRALLALRRHLARRGLQVLTPAQWAEQAASTPPGT